MSPYSLQPWRIEIYKRPCWKFVKQNKKQKHNDLNYDASTINEKNIYEKQQPATYLQASNLEQAHIECFRVSNTPPDIRIFFVDIALLIWVVYNTIRRAKVH